MVVEILRWWLAVELLGLVGLPIGIWLFRRLPDRGISFSKALGILLTGYGAWLLTSLGFGGFGLGLIAVVAVLVLGSGVWICRRAGLDLLNVLRVQRPWWAWTEALFAGALLFGLVLRWHSPWGPGIGHTETPMDFAFLNGILSSQAFPPQDPWLAGYPINYYYFGYLLIALLTRLSALPSAVAFTLAIPTIFALTAVGIAGIVWNATGLWGETGERESGRTGERESGGTGERGNGGTGDEETGEQGHGKTSSSVSPSPALPLPPSPSPRPSPGLRLFCATLAAVLVLLMGNQLAALMFVTGTTEVASFDGSELTSALRQSLAGSPEITFDEPRPQVDPEEWSSYRFARKPGKQLNDFFWWPSRAVWDTTRGDDGQLRRNYAITEFPLFSFILGDMHPHVLSLPWTLLAVAFALNLLSRQRAPEFIQTKGGRVELALTGIVLGSMYAINSWDLPTYLLLYLLALGLLYAWLAPAPPRIFWPHLFMQGGAVVVASYVLWLPFYLSFASLVGGQGFPLALAPARTELHAFVLIFGLFFVPLFALLCQGLGQLRRLFQTTPLPQALDASYGIVQSTRRTGSPAFALSWPAVTAIALLIGLLAGWPLFWLLPLACWAMATAYSTPERSRSTALLLFAMGALVLWGTDVVYLRDVFDRRMNTIFKFYYQVWLLWGVASGIALTVLLQRVRPTTLLWGIPTVVLLLGASFYVVLAPNWKPVEPVLNGLAAVEREQPGDAQALNWIRTNTRSDAVILEAPGGGYNTRFGLVSMATGRPTIIGWTGHERQWRGGQPEVMQELGVREQDATTIFTSLDPEDAQPLLDKYKVDYVYVGTNEQRFVGEKGAPPAALTKFDEFMDVAYQAEGVTIYKRR